MTARDLEQIATALLLEQGADAQRLVELTGLSPPVVIAGLEILNDNSIVEISNAGDLRYRSIKD